tara:strand:- start:214 stop:378 length:165 start_codon:yes stop_codon:yes gene_type:complete
MSKKKMPPEILAHFKSKNEKKKEDGSEMSAKEKRKAALEKAREYKKQKNDKDKK